MTKLSLLLCYYFLSVKNGSEAAARRRAEDLLTAETVKVSDVILANNY